MGQLYCPLCGKLEVIYKFEGRTIADCMACGSIFDILLVKPSKEGLEMRVKAGSALLIVGH